MTHATPTTARAIGLFVLILLAFGALLVPIPGEGGGPSSPGSLTLGDVEAIITGKMDTDAGNADPVQARINLGVPGYPVAETQTLPAGDDTITWAEVIINNPTYFHLYVNGLRQGDFTINSSDSATILATMPTDASITGIAFDN